MVTIYELFCFSRAGPVPLSRRIFLLQESPEGYSSYAMLLEAASGPEGASESQNGLLYS